jgi:hypothetical protein
MPEAKRCSKRDALAYVWLIAAIVFFILQIVCESLVEDE